MQLELRIKGSWFSPDNNVSAFNNLPFICAIRKWSFKWHCITLKLKISGVDNNGTFTMQTALFRLYEEKWWKSRLSAVLITVSLGAGLSCLSYRLSFCVTRGVREGANGGEVLHQINTWSRGNNADPSSKRANVSAAVTTFVSSHLIWIKLSCLVSLKQLSNFICFLSSGVNAALIWHLWKTEENESTRHIQQYGSRGGWRHRPLELDWQQDGFPFAWFPHRHHQAPRSPDHADNSVFSDHSAGAAGERSRHLHDCSLQDHAHSD